MPRNLPPARTLLLPILLLLPACAPDTVLLTGTVLADQDGTVSGEPISGATVTLSGPVQGEITTDAQGAFSFEVPRDAVPLVHLQAPGYTGVFQAAPTEQIDVDHVYGLNPEPMVDGLVASVGIERDAGAGILVVDFATPSDEGGEGASIDLPHDAVMARDGDGLFVLGDRTFPGGEDTFLSFLNVQPGEASIELIAPGGLACTLDHDLTRWPAHPNTVTTARATCQ